MGPRFRVSSERLEKPRIEPTIPGLEGEQLYHLAMEASTKGLNFLHGDSHHENISVQK